MYQSICSEIVSLEEEPAEPLDDETEKLCVHLVKGRFTFWIIIFTFLAAHLLLVVRQHANNVLDFIPDELKYGSQVNSANHSSSSDDG